MSNGAVHRLVTVGQSDLMADSGSPSSHRPRQSDLMDATYLMDGPVVRCSRSRSAVRLVDEVRASGTADSRAVRGRLVVSTKG